MSNNVLQGLTYIGIDVILMQDGSIRLLEINDHPTGLEMAARLACEAGAESLFFQEPFAELAQSLIRQATNGPICLLLPNHFKIVGKSRGTRVVIQRNLKMDDKRTVLTLSDFNSLAKQVILSGHSCKIIDVTDVKLVDDEVVLRTGEPVGLLYRRSFDFPPIALSTPCVNDFRAREACYNKLTTHALLQQSSVSTFLPKTYPLSDDRPTKEFLTSAAKASKYVVLKPPQGFGSEGVRRLQASEVLSRLQYEREQLPLLVQEWIEPACKMEGDPYYFDLRIFIVDGVPIAGFTRRAAAPAYLAEQYNTPLSWLTTTGPFFPILKKSATGNAGEVTLSERQVTEIDHLSRDLFTILNAALPTLNYESSFQNFLYHVPQEYFSGPSIHLETIQT